ncbi:MAG: tetratricopeptide repeat protein [Thermodesulfobacteriota bacterium]
MKSSLGLSSLLLVLLVPVTSFASAASYFQQGRQAFVQKNYQQAIILFQKAEAAGMERPALVYNLGVSAYKAGDYPLARQSFQKLLAVPEMAELARYNLGLVALRSKDYQAAAALFRQVAEGSGDAKLQDLAAAGLRRCRAEIETKKSWYGFVSVGAGYDDNIELYTDLLGASAEDDWFTEIMASGRKEVGPGPAGLAIFASGFYQRFSSESQYDQGLADIGLSYLAGTRKASLEVRGDYAYTILDGEGLEQTPSLILQGRYLFTAQASLRLKGRRSYVDIQRDDLAYLTGWRDQLLAEFAWQDETLALSTSFGREDNERDSPEFSPLRHSVAIKARLGRRAGLHFSGRGEYRRSTFAMIATSGERQEERVTIGGEISCPLPAGWFLDLEHTRVENDANRGYDSYDYSRNISLMRLERLF